MYTGYSQIVKVVNTKMTEKKVSFVSKSSDILVEYFMYSMNVVSGIAKTLYSLQ